MPPEIPADEAKAPRSIDCEVRMASHSRMTFRLYAGNVSIAGHTAEPCVAYVLDIRTISICRCFSRGCLELLPMFHPVKPLDCSTAIECHAQDHR